MRLHTKLLIVGHLLILPGAFLSPWWVYFASVWGGGAMVLGWRQRDEARGWHSYLTPEGTYVRLKGHEGCPDGWVEVDDPWSAA